MIGSEEKVPFSTRDIYLASTLVTMRFPLLGIDYQIEGTKTRLIGYFRFENTEELRQAKSDYNQGALLVEPRMFINTLQALKADVMNYSNNPQNTQTL